MLWAESIPSVHLCVGVICVSQSLSCCVLFVCHTVVSVTVWVLCSPGDTVTCVVFYSAAIHYVYVRRIIVLGSRCMYSIPTTLILNTNAKMLSLSCPCWRKEENWKSTRPTRDSRSLIALTPPHSLVCLHCGCVGKNPAGVKLHNIISWKISYSDVQIYL